MRLFLQIHIGIESTNEIPVQLPKEQVLAKIVIGKRTLCISSKKRL